MGPIEICYLCPKADALHEKSTDEGWEQQRLEILVLGTLFSMQIITGEVWDP